MRNNIGRPVIFWNTTVCILKGSEGPNNTTASQDPQILHFPPIKFVIPTCKDMLAYESAGTADSVRLRRREDGIKRLRNHEIYKSS